MGAEGVVPGGHVRVCSITGTYAVKKIVVVTDEVAVKASSAAFVTLTKQDPDVPTGKLGVRINPESKHDG